MSEPFLGEIRMMGFNFPPRGWAQCDGAILPIAQNQSLYSLLGTTFGGDGRTSFALPDMRSRVPLGPGNGYSQGQRAGVEAVTLTSNQLAGHSHTLEATSADASPGAATGTSVYGKAGFPGYGAAQNLTATSPASVSNAGNNGAHTNMQPIQVINFCIALKGLFPSRN